MSGTESIIFYLLVIVVSSLFAYFSQTKTMINKRINNTSQINENRNYNSLMMIISYIIITMPVALRYNTGADYASYVNIYENVKLYGIHAASVTNTEMGFIFLNYICVKVFNDYQSIFIVTAIITNYFIYKSIVYEAKYINLGLAVFTYGFALYFFEYSIIRNILGISIAFFALRFIFERKKIKYFIFISIAVLFHNSLIIFYIIGIVYSEKLKKYRLFISLLLIIITPIIPTILNLSARYALKISSNYSYYLQEVNVSSFNYGKTMVVYSLPIIPFLLFYKKMKSINSNVSLYLSLYVVSLLMLFISYSTPMMIRFVYALWISQIILFPLLFKAVIQVGNRYKRIILYSISLSSIFGYGIIIILNIINSELWYMIPYNSVLQR